MAKTKREYFTELKGIVSDKKELVDFINHELELLDKKNAAPKKATKNQLDNEKFKDIILNAIGDKSMTVSEMQKDIFNDTLSNQRVTAIVKQLVEDNSLVRTVVKRKAYFTKA